MKQEITERLCELFKKEYGKYPEINAIAGGGSPREYYRLTAEGKSVVGVFSDDSHENSIFISLDKCLEENGIRVPHVISVSEDYKYYLLQDLGDDSLFTCLSSSEGMMLSKKALKELIKLQLMSENLWIDKVGFPPFSERLVKWDLNYFKYDFLKPAHITFDEDLLEDDFEKLTKKLCSGDMVTGFMYRDFQSRNVMIHTGDLWFIDFQGARKGPLVYDAVSFIWQAKASFTFSEREELENFYCDELNKKGLERERLKYGLSLMKVFRTLQVLGAYGFRGLIEGKSHFKESIPYAIRNLDYFKEKGLLENYPEIERITERLKI